MMRFPARVEHVSAEDYNGDREMSRDRGTARILCKLDLYCGFYLLM